MQRLFSLNPFVNEEVGILPPRGKKKSCPAHSLSFLNTSRKSTPSPNVVGHVSLVVSTDPSPSTPKDKYYSSKPRHLSGA